MGMMDRDYAHEKRERPFEPSQGRRRSSTIKIILIFLALFYAFFSVGEWVLEQQATGKSTPRLTISATVVNPLNTQRPIAKVSPTYPATAPTAVETHSITKCVLNGTTSYGDGPCAAGAIVTQVPIKFNHNLMDSVQLPVSRLAPYSTTEEVVIAQNGSTSAERSLMGRCGGLNQQIESLDDMARRPQSGQTQDWLKSERKKLRDEQYRLKC